MDLLNRTSFARLPEMSVKPPHVFEAESLRAGLKTIYEAMQQGLQKDEEVAAFYGNVRVYHIKMLSNSILVLEGLDESGTQVLVAGHYSSVHLVYTKIKLTPEKKRTPIGFSTEREEQ